MPTRRAELDHVGAYNFRVEIEGVTAGAFRSVEGLGAETEVIEYQDGDDNFLRKRPGRTKYSNITLKRGYTATDDLWNWWKQVAENPNKPIKRTITLVLDNPETGEEVRRWNLFGCWPKQWKLGGLDDKGEEVVTEEVVFVVEELQFEARR